MIAPRFASITLALDTERWRMMREGERHGAMYLIDRLLSGEPVATAELDRLGVRATTREAVSGEIRDGRSASGTID